MRTPPHEHEYNPVGSELRCACGDILDPTAISDKPQRTSDLYWPGLIDMVALDRATAGPDLIRDIYRRDKMPTRTSCHHENWENRIVPCPDCGKWPDSLYQWPEPKP